MSGIFMDGGGHDHGGHVGHSGGESFVDGGGHGHHHGGHDGGESCVEGGIQHQGHGLFGHSGEGGGLSLGSLLGLNSQSQHSFVAHLLGLDHDAHAGHGLGGHVSGQSAQMPFWAAALQGLTLESLFQDMRLSPAGWMLVMFLGFISWLGMISVVRHNEPIVNAAIGTKMDNSDAAKFAAPATRGIAPAAIPLATSAQQPTFPVTPIAAIKGMPGAATASAIIVFPTGLHPIAAAPVTSTLLSNVPARRLHNLTFPAAVAPVRLNGPAINVPVYQTGGARVKTIVNR
jgi:hypothetical protein